MRGIRKATHAHGAGESGLGKLIELHAVNGAGDVMVTVALASTVFFSVPTDEARGRVALYLAITMAPFTLLAPVIGPLLDRLPHGRRAAMAAAMLARALLALVIAGAAAGGGLELYPAALGVLVASKAYGVVRSAVVPRLLPPRFSLVKANSRVTLGGLLATGAAAPVGAGLHLIGPRWPLYGAFVIFVAGTFLSFSLPPKVDSAKGEHRALLAAAEGDAVRHGARRGTAAGVERAPGRPGAAPGRPWAAPERRGAAHERPGAASGRRGAAPGRPGEAPERSGSGPERSGAASVRPGETHELPGAAHEPGEAAPERPGVETDRPGAAPARPGAAPGRPWAAAKLPGPAHERIDAPAERIDAPAEPREAPAAPPKRPGLRTVGPAVTHALAANAALRCLSGFLIFFLAFLLREHPLAGQSAAVSLGMVGVAAGAGNALGTAVGAWLRSRAPEIIVVTVVAIALGAAVAAAALFGTVLVTCLAAVAGFGQALAKLSLDALIQRDVPEGVRTSAFARSETLLQMAWVLGGAIGIVLPLNGVLGMAVGAAIVATGWLSTVRGLLASSRHPGPPHGDRSAA
ncbi:MFS transporter [Streptomyces sp. GMY02]|uniref:MFS transporter n=1 Tax=Streptomyces sp. GMY02 TaxID=1333528 RepID=UPI002D802199|nr:MFS transporter [Streptomyces sp. GMY02]